ncbi:MAG TPA: hypothetical protein VF163_17560, partial [Micromonosporaceae bacterium]
MSRDLERLYTALADDADALAYPSPEALRQRVTSRSRVRAVTSFVAVVLVLGGVAFATTQLNSAQTPEPGSSQSPVPQVSSTEPSVEPSVSVEPSESLVPVEVPIPSSAFFVPPVRTSGGQKPPALQSAWPQLPLLCGARLLSGSAMRDSRGRYLFYYAPDARPGIDLPEGTVDHAIAVYQSGAAVTLMQDLRSSVGSCAEELDERTQGTLRYRLLSATARGDDSLLVEQVWVAPASM